MSASHPFQCSEVARPSGTSKQFLIVACREQLVQLEILNGGEDEPIRTNCASTWQAAEEKQARVILIEVSNDGHHLAAVTGDDKTVHIFETEGLKHKHQIPMPKRPCALAFTSDDTALLCGDKFGDVYALPVGLDQSSEPPRKKARTAKPSTPAATNLTVHTKGNLQALEHQKRIAEKASKNQAMRAEDEAEAGFPYEPILGHVSMLTDLKTARIGVPNAGIDRTKRYCHYILSADRDEHIRVSRGIPQSYVIEGFCLGHIQFVSRLCLLGSDILVSGGGDDYLCVWDWRNYELLQKLELGPRASAAKAASEGTKSIKYAVSGLWPYEVNGEAKGYFCACDGVARLWYFKMASDPKAGSADFERTVIPLSANALSVSIISGSERGAGLDILVVAEDNIHTSDTTKDERSDLRNGSDAPTTPRFETFNIVIDDGEVNFERRSSLAQQIDDATGTEIAVTFDRKQNNQVSTLLYNVENLRKRGDEDTGST